MTAAEVPFEVSVLLTHLLLWVEGKVLLESLGVFVQLVPQAALLALAKGGVKIDRQMRIHSFEPAF